MARRSDMRIAQDENHTQDMRHPRRSWQITQAPTPGWVYQTAFLSARDDGDELLTGVQIFASGVPISEACGRIVLIAWSPGTWSSSAETVPGSSVAYECERMKRLVRKTATRGAR